MKDVKFPLKVYIKDLLVELQCCENPKYTLDDNEINTVIYALSKQVAIPVKVLKARSKNHNDFYCCGNCGHGINEVGFKFCPNCGQKIKQNYWKGES